MPYIQTTLLIYELINLQCKINGNNIKLIEQSGQRKDRYSSLAYNFYVQNELERKILQKRNTYFNAENYAGKLRKLNHRPNTY